MSERIYIENVRYILQNVTTKSKDITVPSGEAGNKGYEMIERSKGVSYDE